MMPHPRLLEQGVRKYYYGLSVALFVPLVLLLVVWCITLKRGFMIGDWWAPWNSIPILSRSFWYIADGFIYVDFSGPGRSGARELDFDLEEQMKAHFRVPYIGGLHGGPVVAFIPFWLLFCIYSVPATLLWLYMRKANMRAVRGRCRKCGYNLRGVLSPVCPECGTLIPEESRDYLTGPAREEGG
jgi:hypothetical protein